MNMKNNKNLQRMLYRRFLPVTILIALCITPFNTSASINPSSIEIELEPGDCHEETIMVTIAATSTEVDVIFAFDLTVSMEEILEDAKINTAQIINNLITSYPYISFNFGVMSHRDYPGFYSSCGYSKNYGRSFLGDYAYYLNQSLTGDINVVTDAIYNLTTNRGGADWPENYARIFHESYSDSNVGWRTKDNRFLVNFGDDVPHDCNLNESIYPGTWSTGKDPGRDELIDTDDDLDLHAVLSEMAANNTTLIECHSSSENITYWENWTAITGGSAYITNSEDFVDNVVNAISEGLSNPEIYGLHLEVTDVSTEEIEEWNIYFDPEIIDVETGDTVSFIETICVPESTAPGTYAFEVSAVDGDGINYGIQNNQIIVINAPPNAPNAPNPSNGKTDVDINADLSWTCSDPDDDPLTYSIYFENGDSEPDILVSENQTETTYNPGTMEYSTTYYWYVVVWDNYGASNTSNVWSFSTVNPPSGGGGGPPVIKYSPVADASDGFPYLGFVGEEITFDGSLSYDPDGGTIEFWYWDFGDGTYGIGEKTTHIYSSNGTFKAVLTVTDDEGAKAKNHFNVEITKGNNPPEDLEVDGPSSGKQNVDCTYTASATDEDDDDMLRYIFNWGDGTTSTSEAVESGEAVTLVHNWSSYGIYTVEVNAKDNSSSQTSTTFTVLIDVIVIDGAIHGHLIDEDSTDPFDIFENSDTGEKTSVQEEDGTYLIDSDTDGEWDHAYNPDTGLSTYENYVYAKYYKVFQEELAAPGFELIVLLGAIIIALLILKRRR